MSVKLKLFLILLLGIFITSAGALITQQPAELNTEFSKNQPPVLSSPVSVNSTVSEPERIGYKSIPLEDSKSALQGADPAALAIELVEDTQGLEPDLTQQQVEITYPSQNQILVTITQTIVTNKPNKKLNLQQVVSGNAAKSPRKKPSVAKLQKYKVELTTIGSTVLVNSPPIWQVVWAGYEE